MEFFEGEKTIATILSDRLILTNERLQYRDSIKLTSIPLDQISYLNMDIKFRVGLLIFGILAGVFGFSVADREPLVLVGSIILGVLAVVGYFIYPAKYLVVNSSGGSIRIDFSGIKTADVERFIYLSEKAKRNLT